MNSRAAVLNNVNRTRTRSSTDAMYIIFGLLGHVVVDHETDGGDVQSSRRHVRGDQDLSVAFKQSLKIQSRDLF